MHNHLEQGQQTMALRPNLIYAFQIALLEHRHTHLFTTIYGSLTLQSRVKTVVEKTTRPASVCRPQLLLPSSSTTSHQETITTVDLDSLRRHTKGPQSLDNYLDSSPPLPRGQPFTFCEAHSLPTLRDIFYSCQMAARAQGCLAAKSNHLTFELVSFAQMPDLF